MKQYLYDDTFEGLLTTIFYAYTDKEEIQIMRQSKHLPHLFIEPTFIVTEVDKADRVYHSILNKLSPSTLRNIYYLYLNEIEDADTLAYKYLKLCYKYSDTVNLAKNNDIIIKVDTYCKKVTLEAHRFNGFVRFKEVVPSIFYARIEPDHHILPLIMNHFETRFSDQYFIIHDLSREIAIVHTLQETFLKELSKQDGQRIEVSSFEDQFEDLFKSFYTHTTIKDRSNPKQQASYMPRRYWKNLVEL